MILWRLARIDAAIASTRYRALLPALHLGETGYKSQFFWGHEALPESTDIEVVIFVKAFSKDDLEIAYAAWRRQIPIVLDICDNIFVKDYSSYGARAETFKEMTKIASAIVTTGIEMAHILHSEVGMRVPVTVVPDGVETAADRKRFVSLLDEGLLYGPTMGADRTPIRPLPFIIEHVRTGYRVSRLGMKHAKNISIFSVEGVAREGPKWVTRRIARRIHRLLDRLSLRIGGSPVEEVLTSTGAEHAQHGPALLLGKNKMVPMFYTPNDNAIHAAEKGLKERTLIWFGNHGASYARFGLVDLADLRTALCTIAERHRLRLIVVSNSETSFNNLMQPLPFSTCYVPWRSGVVEELFRESEIALLPNSLDAFSVCKSANRAVLALHHGVPVVATRTPALEPLANCIMFDDWVAGIETYLNHPQICRQHVLTAKTIIEREFGGKRIATDWDAVLRRVVYAKPVAVGSSP